MSGGGATRGIRATAGGRTDMGGSCRHPLPGRSRNEERGIELTLVAWDALVFFTHLDNSVSDITLEEARGILRGRIRNWSRLGGPDKRIIPVFRHQTVEGKLSGVGYMTRLLVFDDPDVEYTSDAIFFLSSAPLEAYVEETPWTFAVSGRSSLRKRDVRMLALDGVEPGREEIGSGRYPLFRPLYLVTRKNPPQRIRRFLDWITGPQGQEVISSCDTVTLEEGRRLEELYRHWPPERGLLRNH